MPGYKRSDVGVIPDDWDAVPLSQTAKRITRGASPRPIDSPVWFDSRSSVGWVRISDVTRSGRYLIETTQRLSKEGIRRSRPVPSGSLIMSICATVGRPIETRIDTCIHDGFVVFDQPSIDQSYLYHVLAALEPAWSKHGQTGSQMNLNTGLINGCLIPLPPTETEQRAIAQALSDVDALLATLDQVIAKKRDLKQATMQQLLTGETRLPGFTGAWETKQLKGLAHLSKTGINPSSTPESLFTHFSLPAFDANETPVIESGASIGSNKFVVPPGAVLLSKLNPRIPRVWAPNCIPSNSVCSTEFLVLIPNEGVDRNFLKYLCASTAVASQMELHAIGTTGSHQRIHPTQVLAIEVETPTDDDERSAISSVLRDIDAELSNLNRRRDKTVELKQAMMQVLLTGKTRLA